MYTELTANYRENGISAENFHCECFSKCSQKYPKSFTTAKESFVSSGYVSHKIPRLVFVSLDSGSAEKDPSHKTLESVCQQEEVDCDVLYLPHNKHWYRTHELAFTFLRNFQPGLKLEEARHSVAHVNSAKCCENKPNRAQASQVLFDNCRQFIPGELEMLDPDIVVTQGKWAKLAIQGVFPELEKHDSITIDLDEIRYLLINSHPVLWIETYHPRHPNFHSVNRPHYSFYEQIIRQFIKTQSNLSIKPIQFERNNSSKILYETSKKEPKMTTPKSMKDNSIQKRKDLVTGYKELPYQPNIPEPDVPTKKDCKGYQFISMVQFCEIGRKYKIVTAAYRAFGGDKGKYEVIPERQTWEGHGFSPRKYVLVSAVEAYFSEVGIDW